ncbi:hypothetical protein BCEP4_700012 [Burkholderia cepacia]|nr:hypothetical protein BCEP4_700012 [Burkholderia cepacia]
MITSHTTWRCLRSPLRGIKARSQEKITGDLHTINYNFPVTYPFTIATAWTTYKSLRWQKQRGTRCGENRGFPISTFPPSTGLAMQIRSMAFIDLACEILMITSELWDISDRRST